MRPVTAKRTSRVSIFQSSLMLGSWPRRGVVRLAILAAVAGCAGNAARGAAPAGREAANAAAGLPPSANAIVLRSDELAVERGRSLLDAMRDNLPGVRIAERGGGCPSVAMRGPSLLPGVSEPTVFLDGTPASDTCLLEDLPADQIARVEVYPMGFTPRPGYAPNSSGLILLFSRHASDDLGTTAVRR